MVTILYFFSIESISSLAPQLSVLSCFILYESYIKSYKDTLPARVRNGIVISSLQPEIANVNILPSLLPPVFKVKHIRYRIFENL